VSLRVYGDKSRVLHPADLERVMIISFDHVSLKDVKAAIPGIKTGGIVQERLGDPLAVARSADLDQMCIDLAVFDLREAERLRLGESRATILANEIRLKGQAHGMEIAGRADCILQLPDGALMIVDHKKSGTASRRRRMETG
jgi:hypothetical protein